MKSRKLPYIVAIAVTVFIAVLLLPVVIQSASSSLCSNVANAQENICLPQEATISAQEVEVLHLQMTNAALLNAVSTLQNAPTVPPVVVVVTIPIFITTTPGPTQTPYIITATSEENETRSRLQSTVAALPEGCLPHVLEEGQSLAYIADLYGVNFFTLMAVNGLDEESAQFLQIGDVIIVPLEGCDLASATSVPVTVEPTNAEATVTKISQSPTVTLAPTAVNAQLSIVEVLSAGDITAEAVKIHNNGETVKVTGWTLSDSQGNIYEFPQGLLLFSNADITIYTRTGTNTPVAFFWGRDQAVWGEKGDVVTLKDAAGRVQSTVRLP